MLEFKRRQKLKKKIYSWPVLILLFILLAFVLRGTFGVFQKMRATGAALDSSQAEYARLEEKRGVIQAELEHMETESGIEEELRLQFNVTREGERTIIIVEEDEPEPEVEPEKTIWQRITDKITSQFR